MDRYLGQVSALCPFVVPALRAGALRFYRWDVEASLQLLPAVSAEQWLFALAVILSERILRREASRARGVLYSENLQCIGLPAAEPHVFVYPHWTLKCMYRQSGLVYGKFIDGQRATQAGDVQNIADLFTIRKLTSPNKERRFYDVSEALQQHFQQRVFLPGYEELAQSIDRAIAKADVVVGEPTDEGLVETVEALHDARLYGHARDITKELYGE